MMRLFSGTGNPQLTDLVAAELNMPLGALKISRFSDQETYVSFDESVRGTDAFMLAADLPAGRYQPGGGC